MKKIDVLFRKYRPSYWIGTDIVRRGTKKIYFDFRRPFNPQLDIVAVFPHEVGGANYGDVMTYEYEGQHGAASYSHLLAITTPATPEEYEYVLKVLRRIYEDDPYDEPVELNIVKRQSPSKYRNEWRELQSMRAAVEI